MSGETQGEKIAKLEANYDTIGREIGELKTEAKAMRSAAWGLAIVMLGWAMVQLYGFNRPPTPTPVNITLSAPPGWSATPQGGQ